MRGGLDDDLPGVTAPGKSGERFFDRSLDGHSPPLVLKVNSENGIDAD